ncbi:hypothetical protein V5O48_000761 [Marasmius crinis-equi]|uniref:Zinc finger C3HC4 RING-type domain-containing protein n=1 Tax=Marasmius crinis-equi TaxID=585013 RepID=A0ABR3G0B4_9AGAR
MKSSDDSPLPAPLTSRTPIPRYQSYSIARRLESEPNRTRRSRNSTIPTAVKREMEAPHNAEASSSRVTSSTDDPRDVLQKPKRGVKRRKSDLGDDSRPRRRSGRLSTASEATQLPSAGSSADTMAPNVWSSGDFEEGSSGEAGLDLSFLDDLDTTASVAGTEYDDDIVMTHHISQSLDGLQDEREWSPVEEEEESVYQSLQTQRSDDHPQEPTSPSSIRPRAIVTSPSLSRILNDDELSPVLLPEAVQTSANTTLSASTTIIDLSQSSPSTSSSKGKGKEKEKVEDKRETTPEVEPATLADYTCPICFSSPTNATLTPCGHICCGPCLFAAVKSSMKRTQLAGPEDAGARYDDKYKFANSKAPDLGQFTAVLRAWTHLHAFPRAINPSHAARQQAFTSYSSRTGSFPAISSEMDSDSQEPARSTVWAHRPIASYLASGDFTTDTETDREREQPPILTSSSIPIRDNHGATAQHASGSDDEPFADIEDEDYSDSRGELPRTVQIEDLDDIDSSFGHDIYDDDDNNTNELQPVESDGLDLNQLQLNEESEHSTGLGDVGLEEVEDQPSLGLLDGALRFIAAERERWNAQREAGLVNGSTTLSEPRRKRRRKRKTPRAHSVTRTSTTSGDPSLLAPASSYTASASTPSLLSTIFQSATRYDADDADADDSSSSFDHHYSSSSRQLPAHQSLFKSTPSTPSRRTAKGARSKQSQQHRRGLPKLKHASSTPQLRPPSRLVVDEDNPRVGQLRSLGKKLESLFPEDKQSLRTVGYGTLSMLTPPAGRSYFDAPSPDNSGNAGMLGNFVDTRGASPRNRADDEERLIHVFVDHSNILIGLLNYLKRHPRQHPQYHESSHYTSGGDSATGNLSSPVTIYPKPPKHLSHSSLTLILERGRSVTRRVLVTSSPLYQPMDSAELLGFEVRVFARVPDLGDGMDRDRDRERQRPGNGHKRSFSSGSFTNATQQRENSGSGSGGAAEGSSASPKKGRRRAGSVNNGTGSGASVPPVSINRKRGHQRGFSAGGTSTESEQGAGFANAGNGTHPVFMRGGGPAGNIPYGSPSIASLLSSSAPGSNVSTPPVSTPAQGIARVRYREQGVDELLQLKLHQAIASIDGRPPKGSTIVLATGDGNAGQFNEDGFLGSVRTALKRGWKVELYAWEGGLSKAWKREFGDSSEWGARNGDGPRFKVIGMEQFGSELVEIYF